VGGSYGVGDEPAGDSDDKRFIVPGIRCNAEYSVPVPPLPTCELHKVERCLARAAHVIGSAVRDLKETFGVISDLAAHQKSRDVRFKVPSPRKKRRFHAGRWCQEVSR
jgi:hypothetical protein